MEEMDGMMEDGRKRGGQLEGEVFFKRKSPWSSGAVTCNSPNSPVASSNPAMFRDELSFFVYSSSIGLNITPMNRL